MQSRLRLRLGCINPKVLNFEHVRGSGNQVGFIYHIFERGRRPLPTGIDLGRHQRWLLRVDVCDCAHIGSGTVGHAAGSAEIRYATSGS